MLIEKNSFSQIADSSFGDDGIQVLPISDDFVFSGSMLYQGNKVLVSAWDEDETGYYPETNIFRLNRNGNIDKTFGSGFRHEGYIANLTGAYIAVQKDKKILVTGTISDRSGDDPNGTVGIYRFLPDGISDSSFGVNGRFTTLLASFSSIRELTVKENEKILAAGNLETSSGEKIAFFQLNKKGVLDSAFGSNGFIYSTLPYEENCYALILLSNGKLLAGYQYFIGSGFQGTCLIRYKSTGKIDSSFGENGVVLNDNFKAIDSRAKPLNVAITANDKIIVFAAYGNKLGTLYRYKKNGEPDESFGDNGKATDIPHSHYLDFSVAIDSSENILINEGITHYSVARYKANGTLDNSFGSDGVIKNNRLADAILVTHDNKLLLLGKYGILDTVAVVRYKFDDKASAVMQKAAVVNADAINVYPNPARDVLHISGLSNTLTYTVNIVDAQGNIYTSKETKGNYNFNISQLKPGVYYLNITTNGKTYTKKFLKE